ncbi:IEC3 subunit of the Ino80 complex, chromatin re-modelling-domain-containing protein [Bisporella sp. PMI_857]|nr:IEC3 subunit of the Ino80 complex, chromatin re-modelling-domain-containing protein [Bisporella sp. PMI_857]
MAHSTEDKKGVDLEADVKTIESLPQHEEAKPTYRSFKKKYRKMRIKFDEQMKLSNELFTMEHNAKETARRIALQNDQLMDLLLDVNNSAQIPADKRIDLNLDIPELSELPALVTTEELAETAKLDTPIGQGIYNEIRALLDEKANTKAAAKPPKALAHLLAGMPQHATHNAVPNDRQREDFEPIEGDSAPFTYLTADQIDDYIYDIDVSLGRTPIAGTHTQSSTDSVGLRNPVSVYNWLRRNEPKIFLQDGEGSEKSQGKPGSLRGAGKRASMPVPSHGDALEIVEEDGLGYDPTIAGLDPGTSKGKRKREEDGGYHPKLGAPDGSKKRARPRKKKESMGEAAPPSARKGKGKAKASSPMDVDTASIEAAS